MTINFPSLAADAAIPIRRERGNVARLAVAQALAGANSTVVYATGAVVGDLQAPAQALATLCHRPEEKARVQSFNDFVVFGTMTVGSFLSGGLLSSFGWSAVVVLSFAPLSIAFLALVGLSYRRSSAFAAWRRRT